MQAQENQKVPMALKLLVALFILIAIGATLGHYFAPRPTAEAFVNEIYPPGPEWFLQQLPRYDELPITTFLHLVPGLLFFVLLGLQLTPSIRQTKPKLHRWIGRVLVILSVAFALSGLALGLLIPFGGYVEMFNSSLLAAAFLYCLYKGVFFARQKQFALHRIWMLRMVALAFTPITMRVLMTPLGFMENIHMPSVFGMLILTAGLINILVLEFLVLKNKKENHSLFVGHTTREDHAS